MYHMNIYVTAVCTAQTYGSAAALFEFFPGVSSSIITRNEEGLPRIPNGDFQFINTSRLD